MGRKKIASVFSEQARIAIAEYLEPRGLELDDFCGKTRDFFAESMKHYDRVLYKNTMLDCIYKLGVNYSGDDTLYNEIEYVCGVSRKVANQWRVGDLDLPIPQVHDYLIRKCPDCVSAIRKKQSDYELVHDPVSLAISRSLMFVGFFPPATNDILEQLSGRVDPKIWLIWKNLKSHPYFRNRKDSPNCSINQHALDSVRNLCGESLWLNPNDIAKTRDEVDTRNQAYQWFWPFLTFKFATLEPYANTGTRLYNKYSWIWEKKSQFYGDIWKGYVA